MDSLRASIEKLGVVGAGTMGAGIAYLAALFKLEALVYESDIAARKRAHFRLRRFGERGVQTGQVEAIDVQNVIGRVHFVEELERLREADFIVEAVPEDLQLKRQVFMALESACGEDVVLSSNTSSIPISSLAEVTRRPGRVVGLHFFNPPAVFRLVEVVRGVSTTNETVEKVKRLARLLDRIPIEVRKDVPGFIVNRLLFAMYGEAMHLVDEGVAEPEDIDLAMTLALGHPMGPFALQDFSGLDTVYKVMQFLAQSLRRPPFEISPRLTALVISGRLGKKSGSGWFEYPQSEPGPRWREDETIG